jgi:hypothetical protein
VPFIDKKQTHVTPTTITLNQLISHSELADGINKMPTTAIELGACDGLHSLHAAAAITLLPFPISS